MQNELGGFWRRVQLMIRDASRAGGRRECLSALFTMLAAAGAAAAEPESVVYAVYPYPPIAIVEDDVRTGYATEIMTEALRRANLQVKLMTLPGNRALGYISEETGIFIAGTKTPEAFDKFAITWPFCFETVTHALIVPANKGFTSFETLPRNIRVGAFLSYTLKDYLAEQGFTNVHLVRDNTQLAEMLMMNRIDAWASFDSAARFILESKGADLSGVRSLPIKEFSFCAVTSRQTDPAFIKRVRAAYLTMLQDGSRSAIRARYARYLGPDALPDPASWEKRPEK